MTMPWFKFYPEARTDRKLRSLSRDQRLVWYDLLCYAAEQSDRGVIRFEDDNLLAIEVADGDVDLLNGALEKLQSLRVISVLAADATNSDRCTVASRCITLLNFAKRQGGRVACNAMSSTERSRKSRNAKKLKTSATNCNELQRLATDATTDRDREEEKKEYTTPRISEHTKPVEAKSIPPQGESDSPKFESQPARTPEDLADIRAAEKILASDMRTEALGWRLGREHNLRANIQVPGWKWIRAAEKMTGPSVTESQRREFNYFATIARNLGDDERAAKPRQFGSDESVPYKPTPPKNVYVSRKSRERLAKLAEMGIAV